MPKVKDLMEQLTAEIKARAEEEKRHHEYIIKTEQRIQAITKLLDEEARANEYWALH